MCKFLKKIVTILSFICLLNLNFYKMQFQVLYFTFICCQLILIKEFVPKMKYLCFDLMFLSKINQVILVAILLFLDLRSVLQMIFFVTFYFLLFLYLSSRWMLFSDKQNYRISQKVDVSITFCKFLEKWLHFHLLSTLKHQIFSVTVFRLLPSLIHFPFINS